MTSTAYQGGGNVLIEFQAGTDLGKALDDVRSGVDDARRELPQGADEPSVNEVNISEFPVLVLTLSGDVPERALAQAARELREPSPRTCRACSTPTCKGCATTSSRR